MINISEPILVSLFEVMVYAKNLNIKSFRYK